MEKLFLILFIFLISFNKVYGIDSLHFILTKGVITLENMNETYELQSRANDSQAWFSISGMMGIEGARILIKKDSTYIKDKLHHSTYQIDNKNGVEPFNIPINIQLAKTIIDNQFRALDSPVWISIEGTNKIYATFDGNLISRFYVDQALGIVKKIIFDLIKTDEHAILEFQDYEKIKNFWIAKKRNFRSKMNMKNWDFSISYSKILVNEPINLPFNVD